MSLERDPDVMRYINGGRPTPIDGIAKDAGFLMPRGKEPDVWAAFDKNSGTFVGWFSLRIVGAGEAELGYRLRRNAWGKGIGTEGARALLEHGFAQMGLERIFAKTMAINYASRRVMEKIGLNHERTTYAEWTDPLPGSEKGDVEYGISRATWMNLRRS